MADLRWRVTIAVAAALAVTGLIAAAIVWLTGALHLYLLALSVTPALAALIVGLALISLAVLVIAAARFASHRGAGGFWRRRTGVRAAGSGGGIDSIADLRGLAARETAAAAEAHPYGAFYAAFLAGLALGASPELRDMVKTALKASLGGDHVR